MRVIDAHHHFWDPQANYHPWLRDLPMIPFRYGDYSAIRRRFMPEEYDAITGSWDVIASVTMEGEWDPADPTGEARWMQALADETGRPAAHVAQAWLDHPDLDTVLRAYDALPIVRSVRHKPRANAAPGGPPGGMMDPAFQSGFRRLAAHGLMFDLQTPWWHLDEAAAMAACAPDVPIILNHAGLPSDRGPDAIQGWQGALQRFADLPNAYVKISGLGLPGRRWSLEDNRDIIRFCVDTFGASRSMVASNFPVDGLCGDFDTIFSGVARVLRNDPVAAQEAVFCTTAARVYGLDVVP